MALGGFAPARQLDVPGIVRSLTGGFEFPDGSVQGTASLGYRLPLIRAAPTLIFVPQVKAGGASFFSMPSSPAANMTAKAR